MRCLFFNKVEDYVQRFSLDGEHDLNCPLVEVPTPHGRLIDVDALNQKIIEAVNSGKPDEKFTARDVIQIIENAHIIIEAEE
jgi:hypothetical protein